MTLCDGNYAMKERSDVKVNTHTLKIFPWSFIWHKLSLNTLSCYRDRAVETWNKINENCYSKARKKSIGSSIPSSRVPTCPLHSWLSWWRWPNMFAGKHVGYMEWTGQVKIVIYNIDWLCKLNEWNGQIRPTFHVINRKMLKYCSLV